MYDYRRPAGIDTLLQDLYTPEQYNPAEYTLMGYDQYANTGMAPMYSYYNPVQAQAAAPTIPAEDYNRRIEEIAAQNRANASAATPDREYVGDPLGYLRYQVESMNNMAKGDPYDKFAVLMPNPAAYYMTKETLDRVTD